MISFLLERTEGWGPWGLLWRFVLLSELVTVAAVTVLSELSLGGVTPPLILTGMATCLTAALPVLWLVISMLERVRTAEVQGEASEAKYRALIEQSQDAIATVDPNSGVLVDTNPAFRKLLGIDGGLAEGARLDTFVSEADVSDGLSLASETWRRADGSPVSVESTRSTVQIGARTLQLVTGRDAGARREAELERERLQQQLFQAQKQEAVGLLAGGVAHDFNNLMGGVLGNVSWLLHVHRTEGDELSPEETIAALEDVDSAARRAADLTRQLLAFARPTEPSRETVAVAELIREVTRLLQRTSSVQVEIRQDVAEDLHVRGDASQLHQVLLNLGINARDAIEGSGVVTYACRRVGRDQVAIDVVDTGTGMTAEVIERAREPFFTTKRDRNGSGLGLSVATAIARAHDGELDIMSAPGEGATVTLTLPATKAGSRVRPSTVPQVVERGIALVVDDEVSMANAASRMLSQLGWDVITANDGSEAIAVHAERAEEIELVLLDLMMPGLTGEQTFDRLKQRDPGVRVLVITGHDEDTQQDRIVAAGGLGVLAKPFDLRALRHAVEALDASAVAQGQGPGAPPSLV